MRKRDELERLFAERPAPPRERGKVDLLVSLELGGDALGTGARLRVGTALLEISKKPHTGCKKFVARFGMDAMEWVNDAVGRGRRLRGVNCRVIEPGEVRVGDTIEVASR